jgi:hypothetical protein
LFESASGEFPQPSKQGDEAALHFSRLLGGIRVPIERLFFSSRAQSLGQKRVKV